MRTFLYFSQAWHLIKNNKTIWVFSAINVLVSIGVSIMSRFVPSGNSGIRALFSTISTVRISLYSAGMIYVIYKLCMNEVVAGKDYWFGVKTYWLRSLLWGLFCGFIDMILFLPFVLLLVWSYSSEHYDFVIILVPIGLVILVVCAGFYFFGSQGIVIINLSISQSIKPSIQLVWKKLFPFAVFSLVVFLISLGTFIFGAFVIAPFTSRIVYENGENLFYFIGQLSSSIPYLIFSYVMVFLTSPFLSAANTVAYLDYANMR